MVSYVRNHLKTVALRASIQTARAAAQTGALPPRRARCRRGADLYPMSADEASGITTWGLSGTTGGSTSSR